MYSHTLEEQMYERYLAHKKGSMNKDTYYVSNQIVYYSLAKKGKGW